MNDPRAEAGLAWLGDASRSALIDGAWTRASATLPSLSPSSGLIIAEIAAATADEVGHAVEAAGRAQFAWSETLPAARAKLLLRLADLIDANVEHIAAIEAADGVRPYVEALYGDVPVGAVILRHMAGLAGAIEGSVKYPSIGYAPPGALLRAFVDQRPVGVVGAIIPWNFPFIMACARVAPALAAGCTVVLKPAEDASLSSLALGRLAIEAGLPPGVLNIVPGRGEEAGRALVRHPDVAMVSFTGSTRVGREIGEICGRDLKKQSLELGGKCPAIVMDDADLDAAAAGLAGAAFGNAGQTCVSAARILAHRSVHDELVDKLTVAARSRRIGHTFDPEAGLGPIINERQRDRVSALLHDARTKGATLSDAYDHEHDGFYLNPVIVSGLPADAHLNAEETFGPAVVVDVFDDLDEAVARANDTAYGLAGSIWTGRWRDAEQASRRLEVGTVYVNCHAFADPALPMGGFKASGIGVQSGREGLESYLTTKTTLAVL